MSYIVQLYEKPSYLISKENKSSFTSNINNATKYKSIKDASEDINRLGNKTKYGQCFKYIEIKEEKMNNNDSVNHPSHYTNKKFECIDVIKEIVKDKPSTISFQLGNCIKYIYRAGSKEGDGKKAQTQKEKFLEDLEKAQWYLNNAIETLKEE